MPTLELFTKPSDPNASHNVIAPGGFEFWRFEVDSNGQAATVTFWIGCPLLPEYRERYRAYRARPTRVAPPLPHEYAAVVVEVGARVAVNRIGASELLASSEKLDVRMGANRCFANENGAIEIVLDTGERFAPPLKFTHEFATKPDLSS